jgi:hypothetical protein
VPAAGTGVEQHFPQLQPGFHVLRLETHDLAINPFGTDLNGLVKGPKPGGTRAMYAGWLPPSSSGSKTWYYDEHGVAHYGMLADFVRGVSMAPANTYGGRSTPGMTGSEVVDHHLNRNANYFWQMWQRIEARRTSVQ